MYVLDGWVYATYWFIGRKIQWSFEENKLFIFGWRRTTYRSGFRKNIYIYILYLGKIIKKIFLDMFK